MRPGRLVLGVGVSVLWAAAAPLAAGAQEGRLPSGPGDRGSDPESSYADDTARRLHEAAMERRAWLDDSLLRYTAVVRQRIAAALRTPLKDRTVFRMEAAHRLFWSRDGDNLVQVLALRRQSLLGIGHLEDELLEELHVFGESFDPMDDRLLFRVAADDDDYGHPDETDFWFEHPLLPEWVGSYRFAAGDTLRLELPGGRSVIAIELEVVPRVADVHRMTGSLWIEPASGNLVRAVYRLSDAFDAFRDLPELRAEEGDDLGFVPELLKPWTAEISMISVDYSLWDFDVWLPRSMRAEGVVSAGILRAPGTFDISYEIESVTTERSLAEGADDLPEVRFATRSEAFDYLSERAFGERVPYRLSAAMRTDGGRTRYLLPVDPSFLESSPALPPPVWEDAPGFATRAELEELFDGLADLPPAPVPQVPSTVRWGLQRPDLIRYNRVEALSVGVRGQIRPQTALGPLSLTGTFRLGAADREPNVRLEATRSTLRRSVTLGAYSELAATDEEARDLGVGNSLSAMLLGRDDGDYYRRSGVALEWTPPAANRPSFRVRAYSEYHRSAARETDFALFRFWSDSFAFRPMIVAEEGWEHGALVELEPWWGSDPAMAQGGLELTVQGGVGDLEYARASLLGRGILPLPASLRLGLEAGAGTSWGGPPEQRLWALGGARSLRGYAPRSAVGSSVARARVELARSVYFGAVSAFFDAGWAGERSAWDLDDALYAAGLGISLLDGLVRMDGAHGLRSPRRFRLELYLDAIL